MTDRMKDWCTESAPRESFGIIRHPDTVETMLGFLKVDIEAMHVALRRLTRKIEMIERECERKLPG